MQTKEDTAEPMVSYKTAFQTQVRARHARFFVPVLLRLLRDLLFGELAIQAPSRSIGLTLFYD
jgi:hypothetical protein